VNNISNVKTVNVSHKGSRRRGDSEQIGSWQRGLDQPSFQTSGWDVEKYPT
jgi:hypothetical protein